MGPLFVLAVQEGRTGLRQGQYERIIFGLPSELLGDAEPDDARVEGEDVGRQTRVIRVQEGIGDRGRVEDILHIGLDRQPFGTVDPQGQVEVGPVAQPVIGVGVVNARSEEHTSELQSLMRISYAVFCLKKKNKKDKSTNDRR